MHDPTTELRRLLEADLREAGATSIRHDYPLASTVRWAPSLFDESSRTAWHMLSEPPQSARWAERLRDAVAQIQGLRVGVCAPAHVLRDEQLLLLIDDLNASVATIEVEDDEPVAVRRCQFVADLIYQERLTLTHSVARTILDRWLTRCHDAGANAEKGVALEVTTALLLSQVAGFEVTSRDVANRSQQMDVRVHNRRMGGILGSSPLVFAEAKNWSNPVGTTEYYSVYRKIKSRFGTSRLGFFTTTDRFTAGVHDEMLRDSQEQILIVPLDKDTLPATWRTGKSITDNLEAAAIRAAST